MQLNSSLFGYRQLLMNFMQPRYVHDNYAHLCLMSLIIFMLITPVLSMLNNVGVQKPVSYSSINTLSIYDSQQQKQQQEQQQEQEVSLHHVNPSMLSPTRTAQDAHKFYNHQQDVYVTSIFPTSGPLTGNTLITVQGQFIPTSVSSNDNDISLKMDDYWCYINGFKIAATLLSSTHLRCITPQPVASTMSIVHLLIYRHDQIISSKIDFFAYIPLVLSHTHHLQGHYGDPFVIEFAIPSFLDEQYQARSLITPACLFNNIIVKNYPSHSINPSIISSSLSTLSSTLKPIFSSSPISNALSTISMNVTIVNNNTMQCIIPSLTQFQDQEDYFMASGDDHEGSAALKTHPNAIINLASSILNYGSSSSFYYNMRRNTKVMFSVSANQMDWLMVGEFDVTSPRSPTTDAGMYLLYILVLVFGIFFIVGIVLCVYCRLKFARRQRKPKPTHLTFERISDRLFASEDTHVHSPDSCDVLQLPRDVKLNMDQLVFGECIGAGSFGRVYRGSYIGTEVAIKQLYRQPKNTKTSHPAKTSHQKFHSRHSNKDKNNSDDEFLIHNNDDHDVGKKIENQDGVSQKELEEFLKEASILRSLHHPNIVLFMGAGCTDTYFNIVTEYVMHGSLYDLLHERKNKLSLLQIKKIALSTCRGMAYLHDRPQPIIHRDLKSHNILIDDGGNGKVCDFGLSRIYNDRSTMTACGTPCWTAPEILRNESYDTKVDVYSFGVVLWEMMTGQEPFHHLSIYEVILQVGQQNLQLTIPPHQPKFLTSTIEWCCQKLPADRPTFKQLINMINTEWS